MKIIFKENNKKFINKFKKSFELKKSIGENILFLGSNGTGTTNCLFYLFDYFLENKCIQNNSIFIDLNSYSDLYIKWISTLNNNMQKNINGNDFIFFDFHNKNENHFFNQSLKNNKNFFNIFNKHTFINSTNPNLKNNNELYNFLKNLKKNNNKEIPIFIENIHLRSIKDQDYFLDILKTLNEKGYFFICSMQSLDNFKYKEKLNSVFNHTLHFKTEVIDSSIKKILKNKEIEIDIKNQKSGKYYYINNFKRIEPNSKTFPYKDIKIIKNMPKVKKIMHIVMSNKIKNF